QAAQFDLIILETSGTGQSDAEIVDLVDTGVYVMTAEFGAPTQLEKIAMLDYADLVALNKAEKQGAQDALAYVRKQYQRNHEAFDRSPESMPVYATIASRFNDPGVNHFYNQLLKALETRRPDLDGRFRPIDADRRMASGNMDMEIIPSDRRRYLAEIADTLDKYHIEAEKQAGLARDLQALERSIALLSGPSQNEKNSDMNTDIVAEDIIEASSETQSEAAGEVARLRRLADSIQSRINPEVLQFIQKWPRTREAYRQEEFRFKVRDREIVQQLKYHSLSGLGIPVIALPAYESAYELVRYFYKENLPGSFPYTAAVFPFRKQGEDPTRMFAGEGGPERTNIRFHYLTHTESTAEDAAHTDESTTSTDQGTAAAEQSAHTKTAPSVARLSTAFDSVTLYGEDPARRPDIYGKVGNSGVSVPTLDDCKKL
ncbi:MAG: hypothetical protein KDK34_17095, partial [Leptospiraceae bacterium]|nr:hypothetical protein [Leptospiraceae bacterium]